MKISALDTLKILKFKFEEIHYDNENFIVPREELRIVEKAIRDGAEAQDTLKYYMKAFEFACERIQGNPFNELLEQAICYVDFHKKHDEDRAIMIKKVKEAE